MKSIVAIQDEIRTIFASFQTPDDKWKYLLTLAREHEGMNPSLKEEKFLAICYFDYFYYCNYICVFLKRYIFS